MARLHPAAAEPARQQPLRLLQQRLQLPGAARAARAIPRRDRDRRPLRGDRRPRAGGAVRAPLAGGGARGRHRRRRHLRAGQPRPGLARGAAHGARRDLGQAGPARAGAAAADKPVLEAELGALQSKLANLEGLAEQPKPAAHLRRRDAVGLAPDRPPPAAARLVHVFPPVRQLQRPLRRRTTTTRPPTATTPGTRPTWCSTRPGGWPTTAPTRPGWAAFTISRWAPGRSSSGCRSPRFRGCRATTSRR